MLAWQRDCDHTLAALADPAGTFAACNDRDHRPSPTLPLAPTPPGSYEETSGQDEQES